MVQTKRVNFSTSNWLRFVSFIIVIALKINKIKIIRMHLHDWNSSDGNILNYGFVLHGQKAKLNPITEKFSWNNWSADCTYTENESHKLS